MKLPPILIVDDDPDDVFILKRLLSKGGVANSVVAFEDPAGAIAYVAAESNNPESAYLPCLVLTDLHMPRMDGIELTKWIRSQPALDRMSVVIVSSSEDPVERTRALDAGAARFLAKYPSASVLRALVDSFGCSEASSFLKSAVA